MAIAIVLVTAAAVTWIMAANDARTYARDAERLADIIVLKGALNRWHEDHAAYPTGADISLGTGAAMALCDDGWSADPTCDGGQVYLAEVPVAPEPADGVCSEDQNAYTYRGNGDTYELSLCLGRDVGGIPGGEHHIRSLDRTNGMP